MVAAAPSPARGIEVDAMTTPRLHPNPRARRIGAQPAQVQP
jgi:hypothetical protein